MIDVLISPEIAADICLQRKPFYNDASSALKKIKAEYRGWLYTGAVNEMIRAVSESKSTNDGGAEPWQAMPVSVRKAYAELAESMNWLAALAEDGDVFEAEQPTQAQLINAVERLGEDAILLTRDAFLLRDSRRAMDIHQFLATDKPSFPIEYINLRAQQDRLRAALECRIHRVLRHGHYIMGPEVQELEIRLAEYVGVRHCITVSSGTDSLLIALLALGVGPGDEVITVPYTWISTAEVISLIGATPVFVDVRPDTFNMDSDLLEGAVTAKTKAIMPVSLYGQCADMDAINQIADRHGIPVIEDAAQSLGAAYRGRPSCRLSTIGSTSFFPSKPLGGYGDGGALFTDDDRLAELCRQIRVHGLQKKHCHTIVGLNGRLDTLQAAIVLAKLDQFADECAARDQLGKRYTSLILDRRRAMFGDDPGAAALISPPRIAEGNTSVFAQYTITSNLRHQLKQHFSAHAVPCVTYYAVPLHLQAAFASLGYRDGDFPNSEAAARHGLSLPMSPFLGEDDQDRIVELAFEVIGQEVAAA